MKPKSLILHKALISNLRSSMGVISLIQSLNDLELIPRALHSSFLFFVQSMYSLQKIGISRIKVYYIFLICRILWQGYTFYGVLLLYKHSWMQGVLFYVISALLTCLVLYFLKNLLLNFLEKLKIQRKTPHLKLRVGMLLIFLLGLELVMKL
ncbi:MAG: hypothetical protein NW226_06045 [Microscillaceae bacterium]|nr:hypothetical protein [Microscillaceae bacterium]